MSACPEFEDRLLDEKDSAAQAHLATCEACRREAAALREAVESVSLGEISAAEHQRLEGLSGDVWRAWQRSERRRKWWRGVSIGVWASAAAAVLLLVPTLHHHPKNVVRAPPAAQSTESDWEDADWLGSSGSDTELDDGAVADEFSSFSDDGAEQ
jgi:anti-sigma factor RsiW